MSQINEMITFRPLDQATWPSLQKLFGKKGACGGCWCMLWRQTNKGYEANKGAGNKKLLRQLVLTHHPLGVIAFHQEIPIGWCSVSPKSSFVRLKNSRLFKTEEKNSSDLWSITCLFIEKDFRRQGLSSRLALAAARYAFQLGARVVEAYPIIPRGQVADAFAWVGLVDCYKKAGFKKVAQPSASRLLMQKNS